MKKRNVNILITTILLILSIYFLVKRQNLENRKVDWKEYLGGPERNLFSNLSQINTHNVQTLKIAWEYHTLDSGEIQCNPIIIDGVLFGLTATSVPFALNAATGEEIWKGSPDKHNQLSTGRGLTYWEKGIDKRILYTQGEWLLAINAEDGSVIKSFGDDGKVSLKKGLGKNAQKKMVISNTPGTVYKDLIIMPLRVAEGKDAAPGYIQAFDIITGDLSWVFHTIPHPGEYGYETWPEEAYLNQGVGGANNWAGMAVDNERGIVYVPTGSAAYDFYGNNRKGSNLFANTLLALNANTGERIWHYQIVHHDILDMDLPSAPVLATLDHKGRKVDAVIQLTKHGFVFVFDRETGEPLFPIVERAVPPSEIPGEYSWPTQPFPEKPKPFARQLITEKDLSPYAKNKDELLEIIQNSGYKGLFTPLNEEGTLVFPGLSGGAEWGGSAIDQNGVLYVNSNEMARYIGLGPSQSVESIEGPTLGQQVYEINCIPCHGKDLKGDPGSGNPSLLDLVQRSNAENVRAIISQGKGMMPSFTTMADQQLDALTDFLLGNDNNTFQEYSPKIRKEDTDFQINRYSKFLDSDGYPAIAPPWGTLNAIDLNTGDFIWSIPYGEYPELIEKGLPVTGSESFGGPLATAGGLLFIAGTKDEKFRAYSKSSGELLWETRLPAAAFATPSTYQIAGKQYVVIACGGSKLGAKGGDSYVSFTLP